MPAFTIRKGRHQDNRPFSSWPHIGRTRMSRTVTFTDPCRYTLPAPHQFNANKLFGLSFGFFALHKNSARFGWYYDPADDTVVLVAYCYIDGQRNQDTQLRFPEVARVKIGQTVVLRLGQHANGFYFFTARDEHEKVLGMHLSEPFPANLPGFGLTHSLYFGGALPAPHDMTVRMEPA